MHLGKWGVCSGFRTVPSSNDVECTDFCAKPSGWNIGLDTTQQDGWQRELEERVMLFILISLLQTTKSHASLRYKLMSAFGQHHLLLDKN